MPCRFCGGRGLYLKQQNLLGTNFETCPYCKGRGQIYTALWDRPELEWLSKRYSNL
jgi:hypothetical protein